ncbi:hypothetical protein DCC35_12325 [Mangrovivirga cuniculi]|uniref:Uncharacterized protein n=1 Tax=Mangrovivirga cuniculi TaxID=2715131 RepID=A0A4D7JKL9_9BACT|nr:hypothetical protein DCC35_12325 [Mangrovivirga cuniculi]
MRYFLSDLVCQIENHKQGDQAIIRYRVVFSCLMLFKKFYPEKYIKKSLESIEKNLQTKFRMKTGLFVGKINSLHII